MIKKLVHRQFPDHYCVFIRNQGMTCNFTPTLTLTVFSDYDNVQWYIQGEGEEITWKGWWLGILVVNYTLFSMKLDWYFRQFILHGTSGSDLLISYKNVVRLIVASYCRGRNRPNIWQKLHFPTILKSHVPKYRVHVSHKCRSY